MKTWKKHLQQGLAGLLCAAMLLPSLPGKLAVEAQAAAPVNPVSVLSGLPYSGGLGSTILSYDCGNGVTNDGAKSSIRIMRSTTKAQFDTYCSTLAGKLDLVYSKNVTSNESTQNLFRKYAAKDGSYSVYTYYLPDYDEARIIVDTNRDTVEGYVYQEQDVKSVTPVMVMWGLNISSTGYHYETTTPFSTNRKNNGALTIIRMRDNSLFIQDGGHLTQMNDEACDELLAFCRELTGTTGTNEKMVINTWFLSHAHDDHFQGFTRFINKNHEHFDLKNIVYNIDIERASEARNIHSTTNDLIVSHYPNVRYYKPHTGESFTVAGIKFDVMYTHEDALCPNSSHKLVIKDSDTGSTYRSNLYTSGTTSDFNDTSTVLRVTFENGVDSILYADLNLGEKVLKEIYPVSTMQADIMQVPHHGFEAHPDLVKYSGAKIFLYTQNKTCIYGPDDDVVTNDLYGTWRQNMRTNFVQMFPAMNVRKGVNPGVKYQIYWGGNESAIIDINALKSASTAAAIDKCVQTREAISFEYTGYTIDSLSDEVVYQGLVSMENLQTGSKPVQTETPLSSFIPAPQPFIQDERYIIMSAKYGYVLAHDPVSKAANGAANVAYSLTRDQDGDSENTYYIEGNTLYIDHSDRADAMWVLRQYREATGTQVPDWKQLVVTAKPSFGGQAYYKGIELKKDIYGDDGVTYWNSTVSANDYRYLCYRSDSTPFKAQADNKTQTGSTARPKYLVESFGDTYLIYYKASASDYRFVYCDQYGNWGVRRYANNVSGCRPVSEITKDLAELKVRLYKHSRNASVKKQVAFKGYQTYHVDSTATAASVLSAIQDNITVYDPNLRNLHVACSGTAAQVSLYRLAFQGSFNPKVPGTYTVKIIYRAEANKLGVAPTDVLVGTVQVIVDA